MSTLTQRMAQLPPARRKRVAERAQALIAEEMSLRDLRMARKQTQVRVAEKLRINQRERVPSRVARRAAAFHPQRLRRGELRRQTE